MDGAVLLSLLALGLASGVHCAGMCGGIAGAFSARQGVFFKGELARRQIAFNAGRVSSYALAGAAVGSASGLGAYAAGALPFQTALLVLTNLVLVLAGLYLLGVNRWIARLEALGQPLWRRLQPYAARALDARTLPRVYLAGALWGWLPCGIVYGALATAAFSGSAAGGAASMAAFGLGTLPNLLGVGLAAASLRAWLGKRAVRTAAGLAVLGFGTFGLARADAIGQAVERAVALCL